MNIFSENKALDMSRAWVEIDLSALRKNIEAARKISCGAMIMAAIKSNAYGHGAKEYAKAFSDLVDYFGVASPTEALELRKHGTEKPIVILGGSDPIWNEKLIKAEIIPSVFSLESAKELSRTATELGLKAEIFIALDTGMTRIGFADSRESVDDIKKIASLPGVSIHGIFTHLACADMPETGISEAQIQRFKDFCNKLEENNLDIGIKSVLNSAGSAIFREKFDLTRFGIALFGYSPSKEVDEYLKDFEPAMSLRARVTRVMSVPKGTSVSYGHTYTTERDSVIATVGIGYADGLPRLLSNRGSAIINGKLAKITGRICMDQLMLDVTDVPDVKVGSVATFIGKDGDLRITADDIAKLSSTISHEIICGLDRQRVPKIFI